MKLKKILIRLPALIVTTISWILSSKSTIPMPGFNAADKLVHLVCFAALAFCWTFWFPAKEWKFRPLRGLAIVTAIVSGYGIIDEIHQHFVPGRFASVLDWVADTLGGILGGIAGMVAARIFMKLKKPDVRQNE